MRMHSHIEEPVTKRQGNRPKRPDGYDTDGALHYCPPIPRQQQRTRSRLRTKP